MKRWFLTVDWCNQGKRGIFCNLANGNAFSKDDAPHTEDEVWEINNPNFEFEDCGWSIDSINTGESTYEVIDIYSDFADKISQFIRRIMYEPSSKTGKKES